MILKIKYPDYRYNYKLESNQLESNQLESNQLKSNEIDESEGPEGPEEKICRICYDSEINSEMIYPCKCNGSIKWIHQCCLKKWIETSKKDICPQCKYKYIKKIDYKYSNLKFLNKSIYIKITSLIVISLCIGLFSLISLKFYKNNTDTIFFFKNIKLISNLYHVYNGLKLFLIISVILLTILHIKKNMNILNIINSNNLNPGSNIIEFTYCIFYIYNELIREIIKKNSIINYINYKT